jgi:cyclic beta-1,2-glucan synthetase
VARALRRAIIAHPNAVYFPSLIVVTLALWRAFSPGWSDRVGARSLVLALALVPASEIAVSVVNQLVTFLTRLRGSFRSSSFRERGIPRSGGPPSSCRRSSAASMRRARPSSIWKCSFLANRDRICTSRCSRISRRADERRCLTIAAILEAAAEGIAALNAKYAEGDETLFYLFHDRAAGTRARRVDGLGAKAWQALPSSISICAVGRATRSRGRRDTTPLATSGSSSRWTPTRCSRLTRRNCSSARWRIRSTARCSIRARPRHAGLRILQPRVGVSLTSAYRSRFASIHSDIPGVDPYTTAVSDVYQDLFGEGSYTGKGIYDVDAFERATHGRFAENALLSHDLIEGRSRARGSLPTSSSTTTTRPLPHVHAPQASMDSRRLADPAWIGARSRAPMVGRSQPALGRLALEDLRQPAPQHAGDLPAAAARGRLDGASHVAGAVDDRGARAIAFPVAVRPNAGGPSAARATSRCSRTTRRSGAMP